MPHLEAGMAIGLYGGSFNPPHQGHKLVAEKALKSFQLDQLWWMVTPGNPLKDRQELASLEQRLEASHALLHHPRIHITAFERAGKACFSAQTVAHILKCRPQGRFVWIMGADSFASFHLWWQWQAIASRLPLGIIDRPGASFAALSSPTARRFASRRLGEMRAPRLPFTRAPCWCFLHGRRSFMSSTRLRHNLQQK